MTFSNRLIIAAGILLFVYTFIHFAVFSGVSWYVSLIYNSALTDYLFFSRAIMTHASVPKEDREVLGISDTLIRISIGLEDSEDLLEDLDQALKAAVSHFILYSPYNARSLLLTPYNSSIFSRKIGFFYNSDIPLAK